MPGGRHFHPGQAGRQTQRSRRRAGAGSVTGRTRPRHYFHQLSCDANKTRSRSRPVGRQLQRTRTQASYSQVIFLRADCSEAVIMENAKDIFPQRTKESLSHVYTQLLCLSALYFRPGYNSTYNKSFDLLRLKSGESRFACLLLLSPSSQRVSRRHHAAKRSSSSDALQQISLPFPPFIPPYGKAKHQLSLTAVVRKSDLLSHVACIFRDSFVRDCSVTRARRKRRRRPLELSPLRRTAASFDSA